MSKSEDPLDESTTVVMTASCETPTRKSKLTYQIGTLPDGEVYLRIHKNTGNGFFSNECVSLQDIQKTIGGIPAGKPVMEIVLGDLFEGSSVNTPGFLLAVLVQEKLLILMQGKKRSHEPVSQEEFRERVQQLVAAGTKSKGPRVPGSAAPLRLKLMLKPRNGTSTRGVPGTPSPSPSIEAKLYIGSSRIRKGVVNVPYNNNINVFKRTPVK
jgi:hypothetical protein